MLTGQTQRLLLHIERRRLFNSVLTFLNITDRSFLLQFGEGILYGLDIIFLQLTLDDGVVIPVDKGILLCLILDNAHLSIDIVLHLEVVPIQMIGSDIQQNSNVGTEIIHIVQLEGRQLNNIVSMRVFCYLQSQ